MSKTRNTTAFALASVLIAGPVLAQEVDATVDTDGDGLYSFTELVAAFPDMTEETFTAIDANADGAVDASEAAAASDAGLLTMSDG